MFGNIKKLYNRFFKKNNKERKTIDDLFAFDKTDHIVEKPIDSNDIEEEEKEIESKEIESKEIEEEEDGDSYGSLRLSDIIHETVVIVDEIQTEASSGASVAILTLSFESIRKIIFKADHTFLYSIYHKPSKTVLFSGCFDG